MEKSNLDYLRDSMKFLGFGKATENLERAYNDACNDSKKEFTISYQQLLETPLSDKNNIMSMDHVSYELVFKQAANGNFYFNKYTTELIKANTTEYVHKETFYLGKNNNITAKEAYNLVAGRSVYKDLVNKEGKEYNAWVKLEKEPGTENYQQKKYFVPTFSSIDKALSNMSLRDYVSNQTVKDNLINSLAKGNLQSAYKSTGEKIYVEVDAPINQLNVYNDRMGLQANIFLDSKEKKQEGSLNDVPSDNDKKKQITELITSVKDPGMLQELKNLINDKITHLQKTEEFSM